MRLKITIIEAEGDGTLDVLRSVVAAFAPVVETVDPPAQPVALPAQEAIPSPRKPRAPRARKPIAEPAGPLPVPGTGRGKEQETLDAIASFSDDGCSPSELAQVLDCTPAAVSQRLYKLLAKGLVANHKTGRYRLIEE